MRGRQGAMIGMLEKVCDGKRHEFLERVFGVSSSKNLSEDDWKRLDEMMGLDCVDGLWVVSSDFLDTVSKMLQEKQENEPFFQ